MKKRMYCPDEKRWVLAERNSPNHLLHLILAIVTAGFWIPVWILVTIFGSGAYRCPSCGARAIGYMPKADKKALKLGAGSNPET